jgi:dihydroorotate dehydrogenase (fumarate)
MQKLNTDYLGLNLSSPLIVGSCGLTSSVDNLKIAEDSGAGAVVLKSLFEEQISHYISKLSNQSSYPEADDNLAYYTRSKSVEDYLDLITAAKKSLGIPVIPSINCVTSDEWTNFAADIVAAGADALEINAFFLPVDRNITSADTEKLYLDLIVKLKKTVNIPIVLKIGPRFSNILYIIDQFYKRGVEGVVLFNRFYEPDIDINKMTIVPASIFSTEYERRYVLRWIAMASALDIKIDISASTGVRRGADVVRYILAGADTVQICSILYEKGISFLKEISLEIEEWMSKNNYSSIKDFRGKLSYRNIEKPSVFERSQFIKYFSSSE